MTRWEVEQSSGLAGELHARSVPDPPRRALWVLEVEQPALVLGSTQPDGVADVVATAARCIEIVRRRSGGGAVLLLPGEALWVDAIVPADDPLWHDDVGRAAHWFGQAWADALADLGVDASVHSGPLLRRPWSELVCFAGLGPGEVTVGGRKLVGVSQRRTRAAARLQAVALAAWDPQALVVVLARPAAERLAASDALAGAAAGITTELGVALDDLRHALVDHLP